MELWERIEGFNYSVSNFGNVKNDRTNLVLKPVITKKGYVIVNLCKNGKMKYSFIHRLVATAFIPNPEKKPFVDHINNNPLDNRVDNLRWCTQSENMMNRQISYTRTSSGYKGVSLIKSSNRWSAMIMVDGKQIYLGHFVNIEDAIAARKKAVAELFGSYAHSSEIE